MLDPRPDLTNMVRMVEHGFQLSEASNMPAIVELRIRTCHVRGSFECKDNVAPAISTRNLLEKPADFDYSRRVMFQSLCVVSVDVWKSIYQIEYIVIHISIRMHVTFTCTLRRTSSINRSGR